MPTDMNVHLYYPPTTTERYAPEVATRCMNFTWWLFWPERLAEIARSTFREDLEGKGCTMQTLPELLLYRYGFGRPELLRANLFAVPPSLAGNRLDDPSQRFDFATIFDLIFEIPWHSLPPQFRKLFKRNVRVPITLPMLEPYWLGELTEADEPILDAAPGELFVAGRSYWPVVLGKLGKPGDQAGFVGQQIQHYLEQGTAMSASELWVPTWQAYQNVVQGHRFDSDPTLGS